MLQSIGEVMPLWVLALQEVRFIIGNENKTTAGKIDTSVTYFGFKLLLSANYIHEITQNTGFTANDDIR